MWNWFVITSLQWRRSTVSNGTKGVWRYSGDVEIWHFPNYHGLKILDLFPAPLPQSRCFPCLVSELTSPGLMKESSPWKHSQCSHLDTICARWFCWKLSCPILPLPHSFGRKRASFAGKHRKTKISDPCCWLCDGSCPPTPSPTYSNCFNTIQWWEKHREK